MVSNADTSSSKSRKVGLGSKDQYIFPYSRKIDSAVSGCVFNISSACCCGMRARSASNLIAIVCALVSAEKYSVGCFNLAAICNAILDLPAPGVPAIIVTSARRNMIPSLAKAWKGGANGSPPTSALPTLRRSVFIYAFVWSATNVANSGEPAFTY